MPFENISISLIAIGSAIIGSFLRPVVAYVLGLKQHTREVVRIETEADFKVISHEDRRADEARQAVIDKQEERIDKLEEWLAKMVKEYMECERKSSALEERIRGCEELKFRIEKFEEWRRRMERGLDLKHDDE